MRRPLLSLLLALSLCSGLALAQSAIQRGTIKTLDVERKSIVITAKDMDHAFLLLEDTQVLGAKGANLAERLRGFKPGVDILFKVGKKDGKDVLVGLKLIDGKDAPAPPKFDSSKLKPLTEMGGAEYQGHKGGLYPDGKNERPAQHEADGLRLAKQVQPLDQDGKPAADGKIVLLSVGMSNTSQMSQGFERVLKAESGVHARFLFVNGAQGGMTASAIQDPDSNTGTKYWTTVDQRLKAAGVTRAQVQAVWIKQANAGPSEGFPAYARKLEKELAKIVQLLPQRFPNVKLTYLSSRTFAGYATTRLNPEPYAFESGLSVRWLIEKQLQGDAELNYDPAKGAVKAPWLSWGPYVWANGTTKRADGFFYEDRDFAQDGTHHSPSGQEKTGRLLLEFLKTDSTARPWFLGKN